MYAPLLCHFGKANPPKTVSGSSSQVITNNVYSIIKNKTRKQVTTLIITVFMKNSVIISNNKY